MECIEANGDNLTPPAVHLRSAVCLLGRYPALAGVDLDVAEGEVVLLAGPTREQGDDRARCAVHGQHGLIDQATLISSWRSIRRIRVSGGAVRHQAIPGMWQYSGGDRDVDRDDAGHRPRRRRIDRCRAHWDAWFETGHEPEKWDPQSRETADHSLPFVMATALRDGDVSLASFTREAVRDAALRPVMAKIKITEDPALTALCPGADAQ